MCSIEAHAHAILSSNESNDIAQVFERAANGIAACRHGLKESNHTTRLGVRAIDVGREVSDGIRAVAALVCAGMEVVQGYAELFASLQVVEEGVVGLLRAVFVGMGEVDEVRAVGHDVVSWVVGVSLATGEEGREVVVLEGWVVPFTLGLEEEGEGICADVDAV